MCDNDPVETAVDEIIVEEETVAAISDTDASVPESAAEPASEPIQALEAEQTPAPIAPMMPVDPTLLEGLSAKLGALEKQFSKRLAYDEGKEKIIDKLHSELQNYKSDLYTKLTKPIFYDIAVVLDDIRKTRIGLNEQSQESAVLLESIADSLICLLDKYEVTQFSSETGSKYQATTQRMVRMQTTSDETLAGHIAESISPGYERGDLLIYPEKVTVYKMEVN